MAYIKELYHSEVVFMLALGVDLGRVTHSLAGMVVAIRGRSPTATVCGRQALRPVSGGVEGAAPGARC
jgi:hypothetical protein